MEEKWSYRIQSTDGVAYRLLQSGRYGFLMVEENDDNQYIIAIEPKRQCGDVYHWEQARYFTLKETAEETYAALEKHFIDKGKTVFKCQSALVMQKVAKMMACGSTAIEIYRQYGREALLNTLAGIAIGRPRMAKEVKTWARGRTTEALLFGDMPTNDQIFKAWKDAYDMRLF